MKIHKRIMLLFLCSFFTFFASCESLKKAIEDAEKNAAAQQHVKGPNYVWDESQNPGGPHRCSDSNQCTGTRMCSQFGWCQDTVPPPPPPPSNVKGPGYIWDENQNPGGPHRCSDSYQCTGTRMCSQFGWCQDTGTPTPPPPPPPNPKGPGYVWDENRNPGGPHRCSNPYQCSGTRICSQFGWCQDMSAPTPPPPPPNRKGPGYIWDESRNPRGPSRCSNAYQCSGTRTCSRFGWCQDAAAVNPVRPNVKGPDYVWDESKNPGGASRCTNSNQCSGVRTCSQFGWCQN